MKADYSVHLKGILDKTKGGMYTAATLWFDDAHASPESQIWSKDEAGEEIKREPTKRERYLLCKIYVESKTPQHSAYGYSREYVDKYERIADEVLLIHPGN